jgi:hypothetical protein
MHALQQPAANQRLLHTRCSLGCPLICAVLFVCQALSVIAHNYRHSNLYRSPALSRICWTILWMPVVGSVDGFWNACAACMLPAGLVSCACKAWQQILGHHLAGTAAVFDSILHMFLYSHLSLHPHAPCSVDPQGLKFCAFSSMRYMAFAALPFLVHAAGLVSCACKAGQQELGRHLAGTAAAAGCVTLQACYCCCLCCCYIWR